MKISAKDHPAAVRLFEAAKAEWSPSWKISWDELPKEAQEKYIRIAHAVINK